MELYIKELIGKNRPRSLSRFLDLYYIRNSDYSTNNTKATYTNKDCTGNAHCAGGRMRSFDDLLMLARTYYPKTTPKELMHTLLTKEYSYTEKAIDYANSTATRTAYKMISRKTILQMCNCSTMRRIRVYYEFRQPSVPSYSLSLCDSYDSQYSWRTLLGMLGITDQASLTRYFTEHKVTVELK